MGAGGVAGEEGILILIANLRREIRYICLIYFKIKFNIMSKSSDESMSSNFRVKKQEISEEEEESKQEHRGKTVVVPSTDKTQD